MSVDQFPTSPTRDVQAGDTPDLNDGLLSRKFAAATTTVNTRQRGFAYVINIANGQVVDATNTRVAAGDAPFVPVESVTVDATNSLVTLNGEVSGVTAPQRVALTFEANTDLGLTLAPGMYVMIDETLAVGNVGKWTTGATSGNPKYARFLGIEAALLDKSGDTGDPNTDFIETLSPGIVPDQSITGLLTGETKVGWFQLVENFVI